MFHNTVYFVCDPSVEPIPRAHVCDGYNDCFNQKDEMDCGGNKTVHLYIISSVYSLFFDRV